MGEGKVQCSHPVEHAKATRSGGAVVGVGEAVASQRVRESEGKRERGREGERVRESERQRVREAERQKGRERGKDTGMSVRSAREPRHFGPHEAHVELEAHTPMGGSSRLRALQSALGSATTSRWSAHACGSSPSSSPSSSSSSSGASTGDGSIVALAPPVDGDPAQTAAIVKAFKRDGAVIVKGGILSRRVRGSAPAH